MTWNGYWTFGFSRSEVVIYWRTGYVSYSRLFRVSRNGELRSRRVCRFCHRIAIFVYVRFSRKESYFPFCFLFRTGTGE